MQISPITTQTSVGFQGNNRRVTDKTGALLYKTTTYFFRNDLDWDKLDVKVEYQNPAIIVAVDRSGSMVHGDKIGKANVS